jgi:hypothetical protein
MPSYEGQRTQTAPALPEYPAISVREYCSGPYTYFQFFCGDEALLSEQIAARSHIDVSLAGHVGADKLEAETLAAAMRAKIVDLRWRVSPSTQWRRPKRTRPLAGARSKKKNNSKSP